MIDNSLFIFSVSVPGEKHLRRDECSEDAAAHRAEPVPVIAVADGHSDVRCPYAARGSELAVEAALHVLTPFAAASEEVPDEARLRELARELTDAWTQAVQADYAQRSEKQEAQIADLPVLYGTTILTAALMGMRLLLLQQGDGHAMLLRPNGSFFSPLPPDKNCDESSGTSSSLCDADAADRMRFCLLDLRAEPIVACLLMTDGLEGMRFGGERLCLPLKTVLNTLSGKEPQDFVDWLPVFLSSYDKNEGQDDRSLAGFVDMELLSDCMPCLDACVREIQIRTVGEEKLRSLPQIRRNLSAAEERLKRLRSEGADRSTELAEAETAVRYLTGEYDKLKVFKTQFDSDLAAVRKEIELCRQQSAMPVTPADAKAHSPMQKLLGRIRGVFTWDRFHQEEGE